MLLQNFFLIFEHGAGIKELGLKQPGSDMHDKKPLAFPMRHSRESTCGAILVHSHIPPTPEAAIVGHSKSSSERSFLPDPSGLLGWQR